MTTIQKMSSLLLTPDKESIFVTMRIGQQLFGIDVKNVRDVLLNQHITNIPLSPPDVAGSLNSRGRIVTVIDARKRLGIPPVAEKPAKTSFVVVEVKSELYSLLVDNVADVLTVPNAMIEPPPANLANNWKSIASGIYKLDGELLVLVDITTFLHMA
jgi:purine-binding chemotaxis protein CheW